MATTTKEDALEALLAELFPSSESLKQFVYSIPTTASVLPQLLAEGSPKILALSLVDELRRRGLVDRSFFARLEEMRPDAARQIREVQDRWLVEQDTWNAPPSLDSAERRRTPGPTVLVIYGRNDIPFFEELSTHLALLQRKGAIGFWHEGRIRAGEAWDKLIETEIRRAKIVVLLVSADVLSSDFVWEKGLARAIERQRERKAAVIPVIVRDCLWTQSPIASLQVLPATGKPVAQSPNPDRTWVDVAMQVQESARRLQER
jgi:hypothetical protein